MSLPRKACFMALACILGAGLFAYRAAGLTAVPQQQKQDKEKDKDKGKKDEKQDAALFTGFHRASGIEKSQEKQATVAAGARGVGEGKAVGNISVSSDDRAKVARMESARASSQEMQAFLEEGKLATRRKGGGQ